MNLSQNDWWEKFLSTEDAVILDVRTDEEVISGKIPQSINIDIYKGQGFIYKIEELDKDKTYFIYCRSGARSAQACSIMNQLGFEHTYNLEGGIMQWEGPIE
ncbi:rhodanese-like domain-containing protein [Flavobacterium sp.]|jgi:rhodanese-related sulfurtransferase|uniref:rhodanese-like domain-containing protein n=1 Tax=Flavobacterium sp. TaxID=239 RepID=UPI0025BD7832|nr:rhodanese-like domain-containing protein [Flavobacterium sp.]